MFDRGRCAPRTPRAPDERSSSGTRLGYGVFDLSHALQLTFGPVARKELQPARRLQVHLCDAPGAERLHHAVDGAGETLGVIELRVATVHGSQADGAVRTVLDDRLDQSGPVLQVDGEH